MIVSIINSMQLKIIDEHILILDFGNNYLHRNYKPSVC